MAHYILDTNREFKHLNISCALNCAFVPLLLFLGKAIAQQQAIGFFSGDRNYSDYAIILRILNK